MNYLTTIGFTPLIRMALRMQGVTTITSLLGMTDDDVDDLCSNMRKPGGDMFNPAHLENPDLPERVPDLGTAIGRIHQERLKQLAFYYSYLTLVNRNFVAQHATVEELVRLWKYKKNLENIKEIKKDGEDKYPDKFSNAKSSREFIESIENWIGEHYGVDEIPLAYVIREEEEILPIRDDPLPIGQPTFDEELIRRASHGGEIWAANNSKVWQMIRQVTHGTDAWSFVKAYARAQDGRSAYFALKSHYMGTDFVNKVKLHADAQLETLNWNGKAKHFTWDKFISRLTSAFADLAENDEPKSDSEKVRRLLRAITDPTLNVAKAVVQGDPRYAEDFQAAVAYLSGQLSSAEATNTNNRRNVYELNTRGGRGRGRFQRGGQGGRNTRGGGDHAGRGRDAGRNNGRGGPRYSQSGHLLSNGTYPRSVWDSFTGPEKAHVWRMREGRDARESEKRKAAALTREQDAKRQRNDANNPGEAQRPAGVGANMTRRDS